MVKNFRILDIYDYYKNKLKKNNKCIKNCSEYLSEINKNDLFSYINDSNIPLPSNEKIFFQIVDLFARNYHDVLGTGWINVTRKIQETKPDGANLKSQIFTSDHWRQLHSKTLIDNSDKYKHIIFSVIEEIIKRNENKITFGFIDWCKDFKSDFLWSKSLPNFEQKAMIPPGTDIKMPWELSRMQHLVSWGLAYRKKSSKAEKQKLLDNFCLQVLDFYAENSPGIGVNWQCTMDVAIRAVNWLIAFDLLVSAGAVFSSNFKLIFTRAIYEHGLHIINNLEWHPITRHNHYLSDIVGLLFISAYLPRTREIDAWLALSIQEFINEVDNQFNDDGTNFEASTSYHRLSAEMVVWAVALILGLNDDKKQALIEYDHRVISKTPRLKRGPIPLHELAVHKNKDYSNKTVILTPISEGLLKKLEKMAEFSISITKPNGNVVQIGDNDNGRFIKLTPVVQVMKVSDAKNKYRNLENYAELSDQDNYIFENPLDHRHLVALINGLFERADFAQFSEKFQVEQKIINIISKGTVFPSDRSDCLANYMGDPNKKEIILKKVEKHNIFTKRFYIILPENIIYDNISSLCFKDFGIYIYKSDDFFLSIRCGPIGRNGKGGHAHNDQLAIELNVGGDDWIADPGTFTYTADPPKRNLYRSVKSHFAPHYKDREPGNLEKGLFVLGNEAKAKVISADKKSFMGVHYGYGFPVYRYVTFAKDKISVSDFYYEKQKNSINPLITNITSPISYIPFSPAYGYAVK